MAGEARSIARLVLALLLGAAAQSYDPLPARGAEAPPATLGSVEASFARATEARADLLAPREYAAAEREVEAARSLVSRGARAEDQARQLERASSLLAEATLTAEANRRLLAPALEAYDAARAADAAMHAAESFERAERDFREAAERATQDPQEARIKAADAERRFREAELTAIKTDTLGPARERIDAALAAEAEVWAPVSLARAQEALAAAEHELDIDRRRRKEAVELAMKAEKDASRALTIAGTAARSGEDKAAYETLVLSAEHELEAIASLLGQEADFSAGLAATGERIRRGIVALKLERQELARDLNLAQAEIEALRAKGRGLSAELAVQREREQRLERVGDLFTSEEAILLRERGQLTLRLMQVHFAPGKSEILPESFPLLSKVMRAMRELPGAGVTIEGHTDSKGDETKNLILSRERAEAVRHYLEANMELSDRLVSTVGKGEEVPIATNDTEAGRALNRRIDLIFDARNLIGE